jgi:hypothetical protein
MATRKRSAAVAPLDQITALVIDRLRAEGWSPPGALPPTRPAPMSTLVLRVPQALLEALDAKGPNRSDTARHILATALGLTPPETPGKRKRR